METAVRSSLSRFSSTYPGARVGAREDSERHGARCSGPEKHGVKIFTMNRFERSMEQAFE